MKTILILAGILLYIVGCDSPVQDIEPIEPIYTRPLSYGNILDSLQDKTYAYDYEIHDKNDGLTRYRFAYKFTGDSVLFYRAEKYFNGSPYRVTTSKIMTNMDSFGGNPNNISVNGSSNRSTLYITYWGDSIGLGNNEEPVTKILHLIE